MTAADVRAAIRAHTFDGPTERAAPEYVQANLIVVPRAFADDLADLCARNPVPCPLVEPPLAAGAFAPRSAPGADLRTDLGRYRVWRDGELVERSRAVRYGRTTVSRFSSAVRSRSTTRSRRPDSRRATTRSTATSRCIARASRSLPLGG